MSYLYRMNELFIFTYFRNCVIILFGGQINVSWCLLAVNECIIHLRGTWLLLPLHSNRMP